MSVHTSAQVGGIVVFSAAAAAATARQTTNALAFTGAGMLHLMTGVGTAFVALGATLVRRGHGRRLDAGTSLENAV